MNKILIIGQAPPAINQRVPYDTTMLYEILSWIDITQDSAQNIFEFDAVYNKFPGRDPLTGGHLKPKQEQMDLYWDEVLENKVQLADKVILLGNVAKDFIISKPKTWSSNKQFLELIHPSRLNYNRIIFNKENITNKLKEFLK
jgi:uracil-DNA glycosylase